MKSLNIREPKIRIKRKVISPRIKVKPNKSTVLTGLFFSSIGGLINNSILLTKKTSHELEKEKPISAGRGGKHFGKVSSMGLIAESGIKATRTKKKEHKPYKPLPQMHTFYSLEDLSRMRGR